MKKQVLTKKFEGMLKKLKQLDDELGLTYRDFSDPREVRERKKREEREGLLDRIWGNWPRRTILNKDILQLRKSALKNPGVKAILEKKGNRIENCSLVEIHEESHSGKFHDCPVNCSPEHMRYAIMKEGWEFANVWNQAYRYRWGGPKDPIKILFQQSTNGRYKVIGIIEMFGEKPRKAA